MTKRLMKRHNKSRRNKSRSIKRRHNKRKHYSRRVKRGGANPIETNYTEEDFTLFEDYINNLPENDNHDIEQKRWLLDNIHRMPYELEYSPSQLMSDPSEPYRQGLDRIGAYLKYGDD